MSINATVARFPLFNGYEEKQRFLTVLGMLYSRQVTLSRAAELLDMDRDELSVILKSLNLEYSYLTKAESEKELKAAKAIIEKLK